MQRELYVVRVVAVLVAVAAGFVVLGCHVYQLQVVRHDELLEKARRKYTASRRVTGNRGTIRDVHGNLLAGNLACRDILAEPRRLGTDVGKRIDALPAVIAKLSRELSVPAEDLCVTFLRGFELANRPAAAVRLEGTFRLPSGTLSSLFVRAYDRPQRPRVIELLSRELGVYPTGLSEALAAGLGEPVRKRLADTLSRELGGDPAAAERRLKRAADLERCLIEVVVQRGVDIQVTERVAGYRFRCLRFVDTERRYYPKGPLLSNLIGFVSYVHEDKDDTTVGAAGVEQLLDARLAPAAAEATYERDRRGDQLRTGDYREPKPRDGTNVYLTIDEPIQHIVETELGKLRDEFLPRAAYAVMANPKTGAIMAWAQTPSFDPNNRQTMDPDHWLNRILVEGFEPGSVMKGVSVAGALDYGVVTLNTRFDCENGQWFYSGRVLHDAGHKYGVLRVAEIIQKSSNIGTAKIAIAMGQTGLYQTLERFGFGRTTGLGFADEATGIFRPLPKWDGLSISRFPIGQGILVTPLQLVQAYNSLANQGVMMQLYAVDRLENPASGVCEVTLPRALRRTVRPETARAITQALKLVTQEGGTAAKAAVEGYDVAGKTGTAQKVVNGQYSSSQVVASFLGYVPADDPAFVLLVVADEPQKAHYGGTVTAPAFSRIAERTLRYLEIAPVKPVTAEVATHAEPTAGTDPAADAVEGVP